MDIEQAERLMWWGAALCFAALGALLYGETQGYRLRPGAFEAGVLVGAILTGVFWLQHAVRRPS